MNAPDGEFWFRQCPQPFLIECNPRSTSGVHPLTGNGDLAGALGDGFHASAPIQSPAYLGPAMLVYGLPYAPREAGNIPLKLS